MIWPRFSVQFKPGVSEKETIQSNFMVFRFGTCHESIGCVKLCGKFWFSLHLSLSAVCQLLPSKSLKDTARLHLMNLVLSVCLPVCKSIYLLINLSTYLAIYQSMQRFVYLYTYLAIHAPSIFQFGVSVSTLCVHIHKNSYTDVCLYIRDTRSCYFTSRGRHW